MTLGSVGGTGQRPGRCQGYTGQDRAAGPQGEDRRDSQHPPDAESPPAPPPCQALPPRAGTQVHHLLLEPLPCSNLSVDLCCTPGNLASPFSSPWAFSLPPSLGLLFAIVRVFLFLDLFPIFGDHLLETF